MTNTVIEDILIRLHFNHTSHDTFFDQEPCQVNIKLLREKVAELFTVDNNYVFQYYDKDFGCQTITCNLDLDVALDGQDFLDLFIVEVQPELNEPKQDAGADLELLLGESSDTLSSYVAIEDNVPPMLDSPVNESKPDAGVALELLLADPSATFPSYEDVEDNVPQKMSLINRHGTKSMPIVIEDDTNNEIDFNPQPLQDSYDAEYLLDGTELSQQHTNFAEPEMLPVNDSDSEDSEHSEEIEDSCSKVKSESSQYQTIKYHLKRCA